MEKGVYKGFYKFNCEKAVTMRGTELTCFTITIGDSDGRNFKGWIEDDCSTGGMEGLGTISGTLNERQISLIKNMPFLSYTVKTGESGKFALKVDKSRKHLPVYYLGQEIETGKYAGKWNFKCTSFTLTFLVWVGLLKTGGTWEIQKEN